MPKPFSWADVEIDVDTASEPAVEKAGPDEPFRVLVMGDFSGRANRGLCEAKLAGRRPILVDRDNFDEVLAKFSPRLELQAGGPQGPRFSMLFAELDDFHPDRIFQEVELFQALRTSRRELSDPATFARAAAAGGEREPPPVPPGSMGLSLDDLLAETESRSAGKPAPARDDWSRFLHDLVAPHLVPGVPPRQKEMLAHLDAALGEQMRAVLHHPDVQALEAAWRAVFFLVRELETGPELKVYLLDISKSEVAAAGRGELYKLLVEQSAGRPGGERWALVVGNYTFEPSAEDLEVVASLGRMAQQTGAPLLAGISPRVLGCECLATTPDPDDWRPLDAPTRESWEALRARPEARSVGLALPGFLLRLPYGKETDSTEQFEFEEMPGVPRHQDYLWGNPAFVCACLLGQAFGQCSWELSPGVVREISGLPAHVYHEEGEARLKPCAEALLSERAAERILEEGPMPLLSIYSSDAVRLARFQSIARPAAALAGRWV